MAAGQIGIIDLVMKIMHVHIDNSALCQNGCDTLKKITFNGKQIKKFEPIQKNCIFIEGNKEIAKKAGIIKSVVDVLEKQIADSCTCESGCGIFWNLMTERIQTA